MQQHYTCQQCPIGQTSRGFGQTWGGNQRRVLVVADQLGNSDVSFGQIFSPYGKAGVIWRKALRNLALSVDDFAYTSLVRCLPRFVSQPAIDFCQSHHGFSDGYSYSVVLALGPQAAARLTGLSGPKRKLEDIRGYVLPGVGEAEGKHVIVSYDPETIMEGSPELLGIFQNDIKLALALATGCPIERPTKHYFSDPSLLDKASFLEFVTMRPEVPIALDIETNYGIVEKDELIGDGSKITQVQFSAQPDQAIVLDWTPANKEFIRAVLLTPNRKLTFNGWIFDVPKLKADGFQVNGQVEDLMWMWNFWQPDLPKNLQYVTSTFAPIALQPWKHTMQSDMAGYGGADVDALQYIWRGLRYEMAVSSQVTPYHRYVNQFYPILEAAAARGIPFSKERAFEFSQQLDVEAREVFMKLREQVPPSMHPIKKIYKKSPVRRDGSVEVHDGKLCWNRPFDKDDEIGEWIPYETRVIDGEEKVVKVDYFNPMSPLQVAALIKELKHRPPGETTGKSDLLKMSKRYKTDIYSNIVSYREVRKLQSAYLRAWQPHPTTGRIHTTFKFGPATGQLAANNPNVLTQVKRGSHAKGFRRCVLAEPGHTLVEIDMTAFHAKTLGFEAQDPSYMRLAALDIHSYVAAHLLKLDGVDYWLELSDEELGERLAAVKKQHKDTRDFKAKPAILGIGFGLGVNKLFSMNEDSFASKREAQHVMDVVRNTFPRVFEWQTYIREKAQRQSYLQSRFGFIRRFYDVLRFEPERGGWVSGPQSEACIAFLPANDAHAHLREILIRCDALGYLARYNLINVIHDAVLFHCPTPLLEECIHNVKAELERPSTILVDDVVGAFSVGAEASYGPDWASMETWKGETHA